MLASMLAKRASPAGGSATAALQQVGTVTFTSSDINKIEGQRDLLTVIWGSTYGLKDNLQLASKQKQTLNREVLNQCFLLEKLKFVSTVALTGFVKSAPEGVEELLCFFKEHRITVSKKNCLILFTFL
jgi:hypothetical protein